MVIIQILICQTHLMSDKDWYTKQGINFQYKQQDFTQNIPSPQIATEEYNSGVTRRKISVIASESNPYGQKTLAGLTLIIITLSIQLLVMLFSGLSSPNDTAETTEDMEQTIKNLETMNKIAFWFTVIVLLAQLIGLKMIYDDTRSLSDYLEKDIEVRNSNLTIITNKINKR